MSRKKKSTVLTKTAANNQAALVVTAKPESRTAAKIREDLKILHRELRILTSNTDHILNRIQSAMIALERENERQEDVNRQQSVFAGFIRDVRNNVSLEVASANAKARRLGKL